MGEKLRNKSAGFDFRGRTNGLYGLLSINRLGFHPGVGAAGGHQSRASNSQQRGPLGQTVLGWSFRPVYHGLQNSISDPTHWRQSQSYLPKSDSGLTSHVASFFTAPEYKHTGLYALYEYVNDFDTCVVPLTLSDWWECTCMYQLDVCSFS